MKLYTKGSCPSPLRTCFWVQTPQVLQTLLTHTEGVSAPQKQDQYPHLSTEDVGNAFSWHNKLTTLLQMFKYVQNIPVSLCSTSKLKKKFIIKESTHDLCSWWYNAHQSLQAHYQGKHPLWPGGCTDYKLETQLQFYHCCYHLAAKTEEEEKVHLGAVQHADRTSLDLRIIP